MRFHWPILSVLTLLSACDNSSNSHTDAHSHENVSGVRDGVWPPEPLGMENEQPLPTQLRPRARQSVVEIARRSVMNNREVLAALGENYGIFDASLSSAKGENVASFIFYNYGTNMTVEAILLSDGSVRVESQNASQWQPTENAMEVEKAIELVRASFEADGYAISDLTGTAMLTYPAQPSQDMQAPTFYDTRMLYVTFGPGDGQTPVYSAKVNIGTETITEGGPL